MCEIVLKYKVAACVFVINCISASPVEAPEAEHHDNTIAILGIPREPALAIGIALGVITFLIILLRIWIWCRKGKDVNKQEKTTKADTSGNNNNKLPTRSIIINIKKLERLLALRSARNSTVAVSKALKDEQVTEEPHPPLVRDTVRRMVSLVAIPRFPSAGELQKVEPGHVYEVRKDSVTECDEETEETET